MEKEINRLDKLEFEMVEIRQKLWMISNPYKYEISDGIIFNENDCTRSFKRIFLQYFSS